MIEELRNNPDSSPKRLQLFQSLSSRWLFRPHHLDKRVEQVRRVMRSRGCFRMVLYAEHWQGLMTKSFDRSIVEINVRNDAAF